MTDETPYCAICGTPFADSDTPPFHDVAGGREYYCDFCVGAYIAEAMDEIAAAFEPWRMAA